MCVKIYSRQSLKDLSDPVLLGHARQANKTPKVEKVCIILMIVGSLLQESNSDVSVHLSGQNRLEKDESLNRMITFSSELDQFMKQKVKHIKESDKRICEDIDEESSISEKLLMYEYDTPGDGISDLKASKHLNDPEEFNRHM